MTSRLDRLFLLLDSGSTPLTRKAAALQLGEVQKLHPHELNNLLIKVRQYLHSSSWETRIAASQAVEAIISNVPYWNPSGLVKCEDDGEACDLINRPGRMVFEKYDVHTVIKCGHNLLASEGKEFEDGETAASSIDSREKLARQRQVLNERLGLSFTDTDFISNSDLDQNHHHHPVKNGNGGEDALKTVSPMNEAKLEEILNKASGGTVKPIKRKLPRSALKVEDETVNKKVKVEGDGGDSCDGATPPPVDSNIFDRDEWPLEWFTDELMGDLFHSHWEVRHGAATGLREIVKLQGRCGGRVRNARASEMDLLNHQWLEDLSLRLLSVLALDRFGDFLSDQVVAPVRETCAQVLGLVIKLLSVDGVYSVLRILLQLLKCGEWEARHGGMLGMKYLLAIRSDLIERLLPEVFEPVFSGLKDSVDDVSAVAAAALVPVKDELMRLMPHKVPLVIAFLWEALLDLDDLSSSTGDLLMLLSSLLTFAGRDAYEDEQLVVLIPRLWPFLSHSLSLVRRSVLDSLLILCEKSSSAWLTSPLLSEALRLIFQRSLLESLSPILDLLHQVWLRLLSKATYDTLIDSTKEYVANWIVLMMNSHKVAIEPRNHPAWFEVKNVPSINSKNRHHQEAISALTPEQYFIGGVESFSDANEERERCVIRARYQCARLLGTLAYFLTRSTEESTGTTEKEALESFASILMFHFNNKVALQRMCTAWIIKEWALAKVKLEGETPPPWCEEVAQGTQKKKLPLQLHQQLAECCFALLQERVFFEEMNLCASRIQVSFREFLANLRTHSVSFSENEIAGHTVYTIQQINAVVGDVSDKAVPELKNKLNSGRKTNKKLKSLIDSIEEQSARLTRMIGEMNHMSTSLAMGVNSALASALISWNYMPDKLNPIIRPIMDSIKQEENEQLQRSSASSLVQLLRLCCERIYRDPTINSPLPKIIKNLVTYLCSDRNFTPEVIGTKQSQPTIITLENMQKCAEKSISLKRSNSLSMAKKNSNNNNNIAVEDLPSTSSSGSAANGTSDQSSAAMDKQNEILRRGATAALSESCRFFGKYLPDRLPWLWSHITELNKSEHGPPSKFEPTDIERAMQLVQSLQVLEVIGPHMNHTLHPTLHSTFDFLCRCLYSPYAAIRHMASRCFGMLATISPAETMRVILTKTLDLLEAADLEVKRQGAVEAIHSVIERLSLNIVPYIVLLIVPMLGRMSDQNEAVRLLATHCFAQLVQLMPLDNDNNRKSDGEEVNGGGIKKRFTDSLAIPNVQLSEDLMRRKESERHFLEQLMNVSKLDDYKLPIPVEAELRTYQQDGLNWLAFLNKYKLHGIVADEMGLGKTLQAICILASDHHYAKERFLKGESSNKPLLSMVICPPTLTGHWMYEVEKFVSSKHLAPIHYTGPPAERLKVRNRIKRAIQMITSDKTKNYNLVIASYDLVRNDIDFFSTIKWNYCILDEGHVIKNGKTKLAKAMKSLVANHRLILTGTPIQNNVLELWSLFDFLMPGFLGTERQFMARYSKPILASRDAKSSSKEQEAGILAMENLHRQVLPFILRRMKEDVLKDLPPKIIQDYYCELSSLQAQLYEDFYKSRARQSLKNTLDTEVEELTSGVKSSNSSAGTTSTASTGTMSKSHIFQSLQYLRKVCNHPKLVLSPSHPSFDVITAKLKSDNSTLSDISHAAKLCALKQLLQDCGIGTQTIGGQGEPVVNQHRALVFCQLKSMLDIVEFDLLKVHMPSVTYLRLDGDVPSGTRYGLIHQFNNDPSIDILLLTTQVGGLGLNLTGADTVIFVEHDWNPMKDLQAMDRAHRIGQKKVVNVYRLITTGTLEEKIMGLQKFKLTIANTVISSENSSLDSMATDQLLDLFELSTDTKNRAVEQNGGQLQLTASSSSSCGGKSQVSMKMMLDSLPELWDTQQYENEYDLNHFLQSLSST